ncbi:MAG: Homocysteine S-methyltransferase [Solirubrobacterales bacterium]|nr:Homocysteine S-methyltransferase [Solirubrobacterales bacterium]
MREQLVLTDGGLETTLVFHEGVELPHFAAFPLLDSPAGREVLRRYFARFFDVAREHRAAFQLDTPTWRANRDWGERLGYDHAALERVNRDAVTFARGLAADAPDVDVRVNGVVGPRGDGYVVGTRMRPDEARAYHRDQVASLAAGGADMVSAITMTYPDEAIGFAHAAADAGVPAIISFTVQTDGRLPDGSTLGDAIAAVDAVTDSPIKGFMVNCAHPSHFDHVLRDGGAWRERIIGLRANASRMSHDELDAAEELDAGDPEDLAGRYVAVGESLPRLTTLGGCCGTDHRHVAAIASAWRDAGAPAGP